MSEEFSEEMIHLENLVVECIVGVNPEERETPQKLVISAAFPQDFSTAAHSGDLADTVDYSAVAAAIQAFVQEGRFRLLETLARELARHVGTKFGLARLHLHVHKPAAIPGSDGPAVSLTWEA